MLLQSEHVSLASKDLRAINVLMQAAALERRTGLLSHFSEERRLCFVAGMSEGSLDRWVILPAPSEEIGLRLAVVLHAIVERTQHVEKLTLSDAHQAIQSIQDEIQNKSR